MPGLKPFFRNFDVFYLYLRLGLSPTLGEAFFFLSLGACYIFYLITGLISQLRMACKNFKGCIGTYSIFGKPMLNLLDHFPFYIRSEHVPSGCTFYFTLYLFGQWKQLTFLRTIPLIITSYFVQPTHIQCHVHEVNHVYIDGRKSTN